MMYKKDGLLLDNPSNSADFRYCTSTPSPAHTITSNSSYNIISESSGHSIQLSPSYPISITIPEQFNFTDAQLVGEPQDRINILSQQINIPSNNSRNIIQAAFLNTENNNHMQ